MSRILLGVAALVLLAPAPRKARAPPGAPGEVVEYYALDAVGSVRVVFHADGTIKGRMDYMPFGTELQPAVGLPPEAFPGLFRDPEAGLDYAQARSYQVPTGRFNRPDPVYAGFFEPQRWNRYAYALNSPAVFVDPDGLYVIPVSAGGGVGGWTGGAKAVAGSASVSLVGGFGGSVCGGQTSQPARFGRINPAAPGGVMDLAIFGFRQIVCRQ